MKNPSLSLIEHLIFKIKSGSSTKHSLNEFIKQNKPLWDKLYLSKKKEQPIPLESIEFELNMILERGIKGFPILKSLESLQASAFTKLNLLIEEHTKKAPFLALIPLFLLQVPSLALIFFFPLLSNFMMEISK